MLTDLTPEVFPVPTAQVCIGIIVVLIVHNYWFLYVPYLTWLCLDWRTPEQGGRRSNWVRSWTVWRYFKDYFPISHQKLGIWIQVTTIYLGFTPTECLLLEPLEIFVRIIQTSRSCFLASLRIFTCSHFGSGVLSFENI